MKPGGLGIQGQLGTHETEEGVEGPGKETQLMKCFLCKHGNLSFDPQGTHQKPGGMVYTRNLSAGEGETGAHLGLATQANLCQNQWTSGSVRETVSKHKMENNRRSINIDLLMSTYMNIYTCIYHRRGGRRREGEKERA